MRFTGCITFVFVLIIVTKPVTLKKISTLAVALSSQHGMRQKAEAKHAPHENKLMFAFQCDYTLRSKTTHTPGPD